MGRLDDVLHIRGVNVYPSAIDNVLREFAEVGEYAVHVRRPQNLDEVEVRFETVGGTGDSGLAARLETVLQDHLGLRVSAAVVPAGSLPRFELKAQRVTDHRIGKVA